MKLNLSESHVRQLAISRELRPLSWAKKSAVFRYEDVARYAKRLKNKRLASLKLIARASEEIGLYDEQDAEVLQTYSKSEVKRLGVARGKFECAELDINLDGQIQDLFHGEGSKRSELKAKS